MQTNTHAKIVLFVKDKGTTEENTGYSKFDTRTDICTFTKGHATPFNIFFQYCSALGIITEILPRNAPLSSAAKLPE
jgi:hypothetical protein